MSVQTKEETFGTKVSNRFRANPCYIDYNDHSSGGNMASLTIKNLDESLKSQLRQRAARHGRSMEAEARAILAEVLSAPVVAQNLAVAIHRRFESIGVEVLPIPPRQSVRTPPDFRV